jgi:hypothetical protein
MVLRTITYYEKKKKKSIEANICTNIFCQGFGIMLQRKPRPMLFVFTKEKKLTIFSYFCKPFVALWLDENMCVTKKEKVTTWRFNISGKGKYLLEIPLSDGKIERFK